MTATSPETYKSDLAKGLGRVLQDAHLRGALLDEEAILEACIQCQAYDSQSENSRGPWLVQILQAAGAFERFRDPLVESLQTDGYVQDLYQRWDITLAYAERGWKPARAALYQAFNRLGERNSGWDAKDQILRLDGLDGFLHIAERHGRSLLAGKDIWPVDEVVSIASDTCGEQRVMDLLKTESKDNGALKAFLDSYEAELDRRKRTVHHGPRFTQSEVMEMIKTQGDKRLAWLHVWAKRVADLEVMPMLRAAKAETDDRRLANYLRVIAAKPLETFDTWLVELTDHTDSDVRTWAYRSLARNKHPSVRALAISRLQNGHNDGPTVELLVPNYEDGDHKLLQSLLTPGLDRDDLHHTIWALEKVFVEHPTPDAGNCLLFGYEATPCGHCRSQVVALLLKLEIAPEPLIEECHFDAVDEVRNQVTTLP